MKALEENVFMFIQVTVALTITLCALDWYLTVAVMVTRQHVSMFTWPM